MRTQNDKYRENKDQIPPSRGPESQTEDKTTNATPDQRKEVNVENYAIVSEIGQLLKELDFPAEKNKILEFVRNHHIVQNKERILDRLVVWRIKNP